MRRQWSIRAGLVLGSIVVLVGGCAREGADGSGAPAAQAVPSGGTVRRTPPASRVEGEILVRYRASSTPAARAGLHLALRAIDARALPGATGLQLVRLPPGASVTEALRVAAARPEVLYAEPNYVISAHALPNDPGFPDQWSLSNTGQFGAPGHDIHAPQAWDLTTGSRDVVVAVLDGGLDVGHPDLVPNLWSNPADCDADGVDDDGNGRVDDCHGISVVPGDPDLMDRDGHGSHVAGTIAAAGDNGVGIAGVAWRTSLVGCKFIGADGLGSVAGAVACLDYVAALKDAGVNVVATNNSWGGRFQSRALSEAIDAQRQRGILFVASAGNDGHDVDLGPVAPCSDASPNVICVGASGAGDEPPAWSNLGRRTVHLVAPGVAILSTVPGGYGGYQVLDGTSMAAPHVTGAVALLHAGLPGADWRQVKNRLLASAEPVGSAYTVTGGRLDAYRALTCTAATLGRRLAPTTDALTTSGKAAITLSALHIDCGAPAGEVTVAVAPGGAAVVLRDDGQAPDLAAGDGVYAAAWTPPGGGRFDLAFPGGDHLTVDVDPDLKAGFPAQVWRDGASPWSLPNPVTVGDLDGDGTLEIVTGGLPSAEVNAFEASGAWVPGWPLLPGYSTPGWERGAAVTALARTQQAPPRLDVAIAYGRREGSNHLASFAVASGAAELLWGGGFVQPQPTARTPFAADLDGDGLDEFGFNGFLRSGDNTYWAPLETGPGGVAAADLFGDGRRLLVYQHAPQGGLLAVDLLAGELVPGFPVPTTGIDPVVGDVDGDGVPEIVVVAGTGQATSEARIYGVNGLLKGTAPLTGGWPSPPALADLDGDGALDIVVLASLPGALNAVRADGAAVPGWPVVWGEAAEAGASAPVIGDVDGDGQPDVAVTTHVVGGGAAGHARVLDRSGLAVSGFPKALPIGAGAVPAIADLDGDGRNELVVVGAADSGQPRLVDEVWVYDLGGTGPAPWGQYRRDAGHVGAVPVASPRPRTWLPLTVTATGEGVVRSDAVAIFCGDRCARLLEPGTLVELVAQPAPGRVFTGWGGACSGTAPSCALTMDAARSVTARFAPAPRRLTLSRLGAAEGTITSFPAGLDCGATCEASFEGFTRVILTATPAPGAAFAGWGGACAAAGPVCDVVLDGDKAVTARFEAAASLAVTLTGAGTGRVTSAPAGIDCGVRCQAAYPSGSSVLLTAVPDTGMIFAGWSGACSGTGATCTVAVDGPKAVTARFDVYRPELTVLLPGTGAGRITSVPAGLDCTASCTVPFDYGATVTLTATPGAFATLDGWYGDCGGAGGATCTVTMTSSRLVQARFDAIRFPLTVALAGTGSGLVTSAPAGISCGFACFATLDGGTLVTLTAAPTAGSGFVGWEGACAGSAATCTVTMEAARSVTARFDRLRFALDVSRTGDGSGTVTASSGGLSCGATCSATYDAATTVGLTAVADAGSTFIGWEGGCTGSAPTCTVTMDAARAVTARFDRLRYALTVTRSGTGSGAVTSAPAGIACGASCTSPFDPGTLVTLTAAPDAGSTFTGWSGACAGAATTCQVSMSAARTVDAAFRQVVPRHDLSVQRAGTGQGQVTSAPAGIACGASCSATFDQGTLVTLTATPVAGSSFVGWEGDCAGAATTCTLSMAAARAVTARFELVRYALAVTRSGIGFGAVTSLPAGIDCGATCVATFDPGTLVTLTATPATGYAFSGWTGPCAAAGATCQVTMSAARTVDAAFGLAPQRHTLTVQRAGTGQGQVTSTPAGISCGAACAAAFDDGTTVTLRAVAAAGSAFAGWSGAACPASADTCAVPVAADQVVTATFDLAPPAPPASGGGGGCASAPGGGPGLTLFLWPLLAVLARPRRRAGAVRLEIATPAADREEKIMRPTPICFARTLALPALLLPFLLATACGDPAASGTTPTRPDGVGGSATATQVAAIPPDLWRPAPGTTPATGNFVYLESTLGEPVADGIDRLYTDADAVLKASLSGLALHVDAHGSRWWSGDFRGMDGPASLGPGYYQDATGWPMVGPGAGIDWHDQHWMPCMPGQGWFAVDAIEVSGGVLTAIDLRFEQRCNGAAQPLRGAVRWSAAAAVSPPGPISPPPDGLWQPAPGATPATGDYAYFESGPGEPISYGESSLILPGGGDVTFAVAGATLGVRVAKPPSLFYEADVLTGRFVAMAGQTTVQPGFYPGLSNEYNHNPALGLMEWNAPLACVGGVASEGWLAIDVLDATHIELRFEQRCEWRFPPLRGKIRWTLRPPVVPGPPVPPVTPPPAALWRPAAGATPPTGSFLYLESEPGDPVGDGLTLLWPRGLASVDAFATDGQAGAQLWATVEGVGSFRGSFRGPFALGPLTEGWYAGLTRFGHGDPAVGDLDVELAPWGGNPTPCGPLDGWVAVDDIAHVDGVLKLIDVRFEQRCAGAAGAMRGRFRWEDPVHVPVPGPGAAPPDLWRPFPAALPASGSYVYLENDDGDWIGGGNTRGRAAQVRLLRGEDSQLAARGDGVGGIAFDAVGEETWRGTFKPMELQDTLVSGYYEVIGWWTLPDTRSASMTWFHPNRACNTTDGWFMVDDVTWSGGTLQSLDLRFEQHCDWSGPALRGLIHWKASDPGYQPPAAPPEPWDAPAGATPATGSYVYLEQDPPASPELARQLFTRADALLFASTGYQGLVVSASGERSGYGSFTDPSVGFHPVAPANTGGAKFAWGCLDQVTGWYQVDRYEVDAAGVQAVDLRFEEHCASSARTLRGKVHLVPGDTTAPPGPTSPPPGLWAAPPGAVPASGTYIYLSSSLGDPVGQAGSWLYTRSNANLSMGGYAGMAQLEIAGARRWIGQIGPPYGKTLVPGYYRLASKQNPVYPRLDWSGALGCQEITGWLVIDQVTLTPGGAVKDLDARFEQHCDGIVPALRGQVHWDSTDTSLPPGPVVPPPPGLWSAPPGATPASGSFVYLESDPGDFVGQGQTHLFTPDDAFLEASMGWGGLAFSVDRLRWNGQFTPMSSVAQLIPGYYGELDGNPARGGLSWDGESRGCNVRSGWFAVDGLTLDGTTVMAVDLRFEQHCEAAGPALRGQVHWVRGAPTTPSGPVFPPPAGLWDAPPDAVPAAGTYVYLESEPGDPIVQGETLLLTGDQRTIHVETSGRLIRVGVADPFGHVDWHGSFQVLGSQLEFAPGYYAGAERFPSGALGPSLEWSGLRFPNTSNGWFTIDGITFGPVGITSLDLRFAQWAQETLSIIPPPGTGPALHGKIHWVAP